MPYVSADVYVDLDDFDDDELIDELEKRGFTVLDKDEKNHINALDNGMDDVIWRFQRGYIEDAMILLERLYPDLYGMTKLVRS